ncbi:MAG: antibiotic biosynthesis monooxygenase [Armatimonadota bacterium]
MYVVCVTVKVKPGRGDEFAQVAWRDHEGTRKEPGNLRFDVLRSEVPAAPGEPELFFLYEVYRSKEDFAAHQLTPHFLAFREESKDLMAEPRQSVKYESLFPEPWV